MMVLLLALGSISLPSAASSTTTVMNAELPTTRDGTAAVAVGDEIYIFGGHTGAGPRTDEILHYDPSTDTLTTLSATLPSPASGMSAVYTGEHIYLFGGWNSGLSNKVLRFDPDTETLTTMGATLPSARTYTSAVWTGDIALIFGGLTDSTPATDQILSYDPQTDAIATKTAQLPSERAGTSAVWTGDAAYIFGGQTSSGGQTDQIVRYDPDSETITILSQTLPSPRYHTSAVWAGDTAHIFGGTPCGSNGICDTIVEFEPAAGTVVTNTTVLNSGRYLTSAAEAGRSIYIIGGFDGTRTDEILRHGPVLPNSAPVIETIADATLVSDQPFTFTVEASDADNEAITLGLGPLPGGATFTDHGNGTGTFTWTPGVAQVGTYTLEANATDGTDTSTEDFTLTVQRGPDNPPVLDSIADQSVTAEDDLVVNVSATDADDDPITLTAAPLPSGASFTDNGDGTGSLEWTPARADIGDANLTITATSFGNSTDTAFNITVLAPPNRAPEIDALPDLTVNVDTLVNLTISATDVDGDNITFALSPLPTQSDFVDHGDGTATLLWNTTLDHLGDTSFNVTASDGNLSSTESFNITVVKGPPPSIDPIGDQIAFEDANFTLNFSTTDPQGEQVDLTLAPLPAGANFTTDPVNGTGTFTWNEIPFDAAGDHLLTLTASNDNASATESFTLTIIDVDRPPVFTVFETPARLGVGDDLSVVIAATDPDGTAVGFSGSGLPAGATLTDNGDGTATIAWSDVGPLGTYDVPVTATSGGAEIQETFRIEVVAQYGFTLSNDSPTILTASPGETFVLKTNVHNTGLQDDTIAFTVQDRSSGRDGFILTAPTSVDVAAGETVQVNLTVEVLPDGSQSRPRLTAVAQEDPGQRERFLNWLISVPITIDVVLEDPEPSLVGGSALLDFAGTIRLTWANGEPAVGVPLAVEHGFMGLDIDEFSAVSDSEGNWTFGGAEHPSFGLVGEHAIDVTVEWGLLKHESTASWSVAVAGDPPGLP